MAKSLLVGRRPVLESIQRGTPFDVVFVNRALGGDFWKTLEQAATQRNILIKRVPVQKLDRLCRANHQGVVAFVRVVDHFVLQDVIDLQFAQGKAPLFIVADRISDVRNIAAIARTAYCLGVSGLVVAEQYAAALRTDAVKISAGALLKIPVIRTKQIIDAIRTLNLNGIQCIGADAQAAQPLQQIDFTLPTALVVGSEADGIQTQVRSALHAIVHIPMTQNDHCLNVSAATAICLYEAQFQRNGRR